MSHEIIKSIAINEKAGTVFITSHSNNVTPRTPKRWQCEYLENMLRDKGRKAVDDYIMDQYKGGMMRGGKNDYNHATTLGISLTELRALKDGHKYVIRAGSGYIMRTTARSAKITWVSHAAKHYDQVSAMVVARRFNGATIERV